MRILPQLNQEEESPIEILLKQISQLRPASLRVLPPLGPKEESIFEKFLKQIEAGVELRPASRRVLPPLLKKESIFKKIMKEIYAGISLKPVTRRIADYPDSPAIPHHGAEISSGKNTDEELPCPSLQTSAAIMSERSEVSKVDLPSTTTIS